MGRLLSLDYGKKRIGLALSDPLKITAQPFQIILNSHQDVVLQTLQSVVKEQEVEAVIVGYPLSLNGTMGKSTQQVDRFIHMLEKKISLPIIRWDERFTTVEAHRALHAMGRKPSKNKQKVDIIAATLILQNYLDSQELCASEKNEDNI